MTVIIQAITFTFGLISLFSILLLGKWGVKTGYYRWILVWLLHLVLFYIVILFNLDAAFVLDRIKWSAILRLHLVASITFYIIPALWQEWQQLRMIKRKSKKLTQKEGASDDNST